MKYIILLTISSMLLSFSLDKKSFIFKKKQYINFKLNKTEYCLDCYSLYLSSVTGNKSKLSKRTKKIFKRYGLLHLLTPSGLHLSSLIFLVKRFAFLQILSLILLFIYLREFDAYQSMERVILFRLLRLCTLKKLNNETCFFITFILALILGHFNNNSLSFTFSLLFWGTILIFRTSKIKMILYLNMSLLLTCTLLGNLYSPSSLIINPLMTAIYSAFFPILFVNLILPETTIFTEGINFFLENFLLMLQFIEANDPFPEIRIHFLTFFMAILFLTLRRFKLFIFILLLNVNETQIHKVKHIQSRIVNIEKHRYLNSKKWSMGRKTKCKSEKFRIICKKKPSKKWRAKQYYTL